MNLLLLLSALLSALTGAGVGVRRPEVAQAVSGRSVAAQPAPIVAVRVGKRPSAALPGLIASAMLPWAIVPVMIEPVDLWTTRRRE